MTTTTAFTKVLRIGTIPIGTRLADVFVNVVYDAKGELHLTGVEGPLANGNAIGGCGQIEMSMDTVYRDACTYAPGWDRVLLDRLLDIWSEYHLNHMRPGSPAQTAYLKANPIDPKDYAYPKSHYEVAGAVLAAAGLNPDPGLLYSGVNSRPAEPHPYKYGEAWLKSDVPADVLDFLRALPDTDRTPAWV